MKSGLVAIIGQPNVGKSTLTNALVGQKVSIVSSKPQTTRRRVIGIAQGDGYQVALVDTPGIHEPHTRLGRAMVEQARGALGDVDAILVVVDASRLPNELDREIARLVRAAAGLPTTLPSKTFSLADIEDVEEVPEKPPRPTGKIPIILCLNKMDLLKPEHVVENTETFADLFSTDKWMLTQATRELNLNKLLDLLTDVLPEGDPMFPEDEYTDQSSRFIVAELIREKVLLSTKEEVPHATGVRVDEWAEQEDGSLEITATILVERPGQRAILIGKGGQFIKKIGMEARAEIEALLDRHIYLDLHIIAREGWRQNPRMLKELEYTE